MCACVQQTFILHMTACGLLLVQFQTTVDWGEPSQTFVHRSIARLSIAATNTALCTTTNCLRVSNSSYDHVSNDNYDPHLARVSTRNFPLYITASKPCGQKHAEKYLPSRLAAEAERGQRQP